MLRGMLCLLTLHAILLTGCNKESPAEPGTAANSFDGTWTVVNSSILGAPRPDTIMANPKALEFVFQGDEVNCLGNKCRYRADPTKQPTTIDIAPATGGTAYQGIARWEAGKLYLTVAAQGQPRPSNFDELESNITKCVLVLARK